MSKKKIVITGGGTGGHVFPALAMAEELRRRKMTVLYVGSAKGMESKLVPQKGFPFYEVSSGAIKNQSFLKMLSTLFQLLRGVLWSIGFLLREKPQLTLGVGGYVSFPICFASFLLRIPIYLQEQNASVGISNRILGHLATRIFLGFEEARSAFNPKKCLVTGNPLRQVFLDAEPEPFLSEKNHLLIMGGSQGAKVINETFMELIPEIIRQFPEITITHQTGVSDAHRVEEHYQKTAPGKCKVLPFIENIAEAYNQASLVVCRSGALTVSELVHMGRPAIFVPYPRRGQNDQTANARFLQDQGAALVVEQGHDFKDRRWKARETTKRA